MLDFGYIVNGEESVHLTRPNIRLPWQDFTPYELAAVQPYGVKPKFLSKLESLYACSQVA